MEKVEFVKFETNSFGKRLKSMLTVDFRRMLTMKFFYIMLGISIAIPILILVMTTMMDGSVSVNPQTGEETVMEGFDNTWQIIGTVSGEGSAMSMDMTSMCNINLLYFIIAVFVCVFIAEDFRSGYTKNLFTVRAKKTDYIISKSLAGIFGGVCMVLGFIVGAMLGGAISGLPFDIGTAGVSGIVMCLLAKVFLVSVFVPIYIFASVIAKQKLWLSLIVSLGIGMLLFNMIPMLTPLDSTIVNVGLCLGGGLIFCLGFGAAGNVILKKTSFI